MKRAILVSVALTMVACGGSKDGGKVSARATADKLGCSLTVDPADDRELFVADSGSCDFNGSEVRVYAFSNNKTRDNWIDTATQFGVGRFVVLDRGVVTSDDQDAADAVKAKVGGEIRTG